MTQLEVICCECKQPVWVDVEDEALNSPMLETFKRIMRCNRCTDLIESKRRSRFYAQQKPKDGNLPF